VTLKEIRRRYISGGKPAPTRILTSLAIDPRSGAQALYRTLERRRRAARAEHERVATMLNFERLLWKAGVERIAGVDEVGLGPLAGPVVAAAVVLPSDIDLDGVDDSKRLDAPTRERLDREIRERASSYAIVEVSVEELDRMNVYRAGVEALRRAVKALDVTPDHVLSDAREIPDLDGIPLNAFKKGDGLSYSIASASIIAKVYRDRRMTELADQYPGYGFEDHKGYGTPRHLEAIRELGTCAIHRQSYPALRQVLGQAAPLFYELRDDIQRAASLTELEPVQERLRAAGEQMALAEARKLSALLGRRRKRLS